MAPKRKKSAGKHGGNSPRGKKTQAKSAPSSPQTPKTLIQAAEGPASSVKRKLGRETSDDKIERGIKDHFPHFTATEISTIKDDQGRDLRERLKFERRAKKELNEKARLGALTYKAVAKEWEHLRAGTSLEVSDKGLDISQELYDALDAATHSFPCLCLGFLGHVLN